jgi:hypothetical protein
MMKFEMNAITFRGSLLNGPITTRQIVYKVV